MADTITDNSPAKSANDVREEIDKKSLQAKAIAAMFGQALEMYGNVPDDTFSNASWVLLDLLDDIQGGSEDLFKRASAAEVAPVVPSSN